MKGARLRRASFIIFAVALLSLELTALNTPGEAFATQSPSPDQPKAPSPQPYVPFSASKSILIISLGGDDATRGKLLATFTQRLEKLQQSAPLPLIAQPQWTLSDLVSACQDHQDEISGAFIITLLSVSSGVRSHFISRTNHTTVTASAAFAECTPDKTNSPKGSLQIVWASGQATEDGKASTLLPLNGLAILLSAVFVFLAFAPSKTATTQTTTVFPTPAPLPAAGVVSQRQQTGTSTTNVSQLGTIGTAFLAQSFSYSNSLAVLPTNDDSKEA